MYDLSEQVSVLDAESELRVGVIVFRNKEPVDLFPNFTNIVQKKRRNHAVIPEAAYSI